MAFTYSSCLRLIISPDLFFGFPDTHTQHSNTRSYKTRLPPLSTDANTHTSEHLLLNNVHTNRPPNQAKHTQASLLPHVSSYTNTLLRHVTTRDLLSHQGTTLKDSTKSKPSYRPEPRQLPPFVYRTTGNSRKDKTLTFF
jgi:hypothetical protein